MTITIDIDGVIAGGDYDPSWCQHPLEHYPHLPAIFQAPEYVNKLADDGHVIYYVTSRAFDGAEDITLDWLERYNFPCIQGNSLGGLITHVPGDDKWKISKEFGAKYHIDDRPNTLKHYYTNCNTIPIMFINRNPIGWWPGTLHAKSEFIYFEDWARLYTFIKESK